MNHTNHTTINVEHLPEIVLEYILCQVSLYSDLKHCMLVNRRWYNLSKAAVRKVQRDLQHALINRQILWRHMLPEPGPKISERYAHSCCVNGDSMYVFGGCTTANTTFNDLWRLDLATRRWIRPLATGTYPSPKACATLVSHKDNLVLFGGWTHTSPYSPYQNRKIFGHLHVYSISTNRWTQIVTTCTSPSLGGHTATLQNDEMVVFGGLECPNGAGIFSSTNDVWVLNLKEWTWRKQATTSPQPHPRYGHSQVSIDNKNILIFGGCGGPNMLFNDVWLLRKSVEEEEPWEWIELTVLKKENGTPHLAFHPVCKVGNHVVVLSRGQQYRSSPSCLPQVLRVPSRIWVPPQADSRPHSRSSHQQEVCLNGKKGVLKRQKVDSQFPVSSSDEDEKSQSKEQAKKLVSTNRSQTQATCDTTLSKPGPSHEIKTSETLGTSTSHKQEINPRPILCIRPNAQSNRQRQLESLERMEQRIRRLRAGSKPCTYPSGRRQQRISSPSRNAMCIYVLDIGEATEKRSVSWVPFPTESPLSFGPEEMILFSLVLGRGELIMFGGIQKDLVSKRQEGEAVPDVVSNSLHFICPEHFSL